MARSPHESYPKTSNGNPAAVNYHQLAADGDDNSLATQEILKHTLEKPKIVQKRGLNFSKFVIHILALLITAGVVGLNFATVYCWDQGNYVMSDTQANNLLQFAAKLHEVIIVGSLTSIVLQHIRQRLISGQGLPFGLLSSGYQLSSLEYLFSSGFWSAFMTDGGLVLALAATIIYVAMLAGSALPDENGPPNMTLYEGCDTIEYTSACPGAGFRALKDWAGSWNRNGVPPNISMTEFTTHTERALLIETKLRFSTTTTLAQPILELTGLFWDYIRRGSVNRLHRFSKPALVTNDTAPVYAPVVEVECESFDYSEAIKGLDPDNSTTSSPLAVPDKNTTGAWHVDPMLWNFTRPMNATNFTWVDVSSYSDRDGTGASLGALFTASTTGLLNATMNDTFWDVSQQSLLIPCLIKAKWATKIQYDPNSSNQIVSNTTKAYLTKGFKGLEGLSDTILISPEWAALLYVAGISYTSITGETLNATMMEVLTQEFIVSYVNPKYSPYLAKGENFSMFGPTTSTEILAGTLGAVVAEGLSHQAYSWIVLYAVRGQGPNSTVVTPLLEQETSESSKANVLNVSLAAFESTLEGSSTLIDYTIKQYGYGYGYQGTPTVAIGLAVLLTHAATATAFIICTIYHRIAGTGFTSSAWDEMGEMLALAMHSERATELQNVGGGVKAKSTWRMRVRVRERKGENLELVVGQRDLDGVQPCLNKKYH